MEEFEYDDDFLAKTIKIAFEDKENYCVPRGINRLDYINNHGWWVRVTRDNAQFKKLFSDGLHGSPEQSLHAAIKYRHEIISSFPVTLKTQSGRSLPLEPNQRIWRIETKGKKQPYICWKARWYDENFKAHNKSFSVKKFGEKEARLMALSTATKEHNNKIKLSKVPDNYSNFKTKELNRYDIKLLTSASRGDYENIKSEDIEDAPFAFEGEETFVIHKAIERNKSLRDAKILDFLTSHDTLHCEVCSFNFSETYPFLEKNLIEVHHIIPLASLTKAEKTELKDLVLLCSNCHFAIHQGNCTDNLTKAYQLFKSDRNEKNR